METSLKIREITNALENWAPRSLQEDYDNAGLICGDPANEVNKAIICLDVTEEVIEEAIESGAQLVIAHHPIVFRGLKKINGGNYVERVIIKAIKNDIAVYAAHTNLDNIHTGVNRIIGEKMGVNNMQVLVPKSGSLSKLVTYCPVAQAEDVRSALFSAGAGKIGNYSECSFNTEGNGTFKGEEGSEPFAGEIGKRHTEREMRIEVVLPSERINHVTRELKKAHPYEEVAYEVYSLENRNKDVGAGMIGSLDKPMDLEKFLSLIKETFNCGSIRHTKKIKSEVSRIAWCGGAGSFLLNAAKAHHADVFITGDFKYHEFFDADNDLVIADIGHYESEQFTMNLIADFLKGIFPTFAVRLTEVYTNPVNYY